MEMDCHSARPLQNPEHGMTPFKTAFGTQYCPRPKNY